MIEYLESNDDVISCRIRNGFSGEEMLELTERLEKAAETNDKTHMFLEIENLDGIDWRMVGEAVPKGLSLLGKLGRFGRIAVVSDDKWVRGLTRLESALLPNISYEVYHSSERQRALDWVEGRVEKPHEPALTIIETDDPNIIAFAIDGWVTTDTIDDAVDRVAPLLDRAEGKVRVLARVGEFHFNSFRPFLDRRYVTFKVDAMKRTERYALVGGPDWLRMLSETMGALFPFEVRHFDSDDEDEAWEWLKAAPAGKQPRTERIPADAEA